MQSSLYEELQTSDVRMLSSWLKKKINKCCNVESIHCDNRPNANYTSEPLYRPSRRIHLNVHFFFIEFDRGMVAKGVCGMLHDVITQMVCTSGSPVNDEIYAFSRYIARDQDLEQLTTKSSLKSMTKNLKELPVH